MSWERRSGEWGRGATGGGKSFVLFFLEREEYVCERGEEYKGKEWGGVRVCVIVKGGWGGGGGG